VTRAYSLTRTFDSDSDQGHWQIVVVIDSEVCPGQCLSSGSSEVLHTAHADIQRPSLASWTERPVTYFKFPNHQLEVITWRLQLQCSMPPCNCNQSGHWPTATRWYSSRPDQVTGTQEAAVQQGCQSPKILQQEVWSVLITCYITPLLHSLWWYITHCYITYGCYITGC
jgi:hypothetical protein